MCRRHRDRPRRHRPPQRGWDGCRLGSGARGRSTTPAPYLSHAQAVRVRCAEAATAARARPEIRYLSPALAVPRCWQRAPGRTVCEPSAGSLCAEHLLAAPPLRILLPQPCSGAPRAPQPSPTSQPSHHHRESPQTLEEPSSETGPRGAVPNAPRHRARFREHRPGCAWIF